MSIFEAMMLICFGAAWPSSIYKSYTSRTSRGKSIAFLIIVLAGYAAGILHKFFYNFDPVIYLYIINALMVLADIVLYFRNSRLDYNPV
jgi:hypothetical protein